MQENFHNWKGTCHFLSGGTATGRYKKISYDVRKWAFSVRVTREVLSAHGVNASSVVIVLQPFAPWAIGSVFSQACLELGAGVYPFGLYANEEIFRDMMVDLSPTHLCASARNLIRWKTAINKNEAGRALRVEKCFVAGEKLLKEQRAECSRLWGAETVNIYGMSEFDTVAAEATSSAGRMILCPYLNYRLEIEGKEHLPCAGLTGELLIGRGNDTAWYHTGDVVTVTERTNKSNLWPSGKWEINFLNRSSPCASLMDGSQVNEGVHQYVKTAFSFVSNLQIVIRHRKSFNLVELLVETDVALGRKQKNDIRSAFVRSNIDIMDAFGRGVIRNVTVRGVSADNFYTTSRDKVPQIINL